MEVSFLKCTRNRSIVLTIMALAFLCGICFFIYRFVTSANLWALSPINKHLSGVNAALYGDILDRNGIVLAHTKDNIRSYNSDGMIRKAVLHTVGDNDSQIATSIQASYRDELSGYNFIFGVNTPKIFKQSKNIQITLDSEICKAALSAIGEYKGAICIYNYKTGEIVCMVSAPTFDPYHPEAVANDKSGKYEGAYINRVISSSFAPGSVFKLVTTAAGLTFIDDIEDKIYSCHQTEIVNGEKITCLSNHGDIKLKNAMMESCNIYFAKLAIDLGKSNMTKMANEMGFNKNFSFDRLTTKKSVYDVSDADDYYLGWSGVGQYKDLLNPMHSNILMGSIANSGEAVLPCIVKRDQVNKKVERFLTKEVADKLKEMMRYNVTANYGDSMFPGLNVCAKTGTAEVGENQKPHGWMVGFSANEDTPLAFSVVVENAGYGSKTAGPIASKVLNLAAKKCLNKQ